MDNAQDFNNIKQAGQDSFEDSELQMSQSILDAFFGNCNEEEKNINEFSHTLGIRANDAIWVFVKVFFTINRENNNLPQRIADALLNAPAGWIIPLALIPVGGGTLFRGLIEQGRAKYLNLSRLSSSLFGAIRPSSYSLEHIFTPFSCGLKEGEILYATYVL